MTRAQVVRDTQRHAHGRLGGSPLLGRVHHVGGGGVLHIQTERHRFVGSRRGRGARRSVLHRGDNQTEHVIGEWGAVWGKQLETNQLRAFLLSSEQAEESRVLLLSRLLLWQICKTYEN